MDVKGAAALATIKKGPGYRSSFSGMVATIFGANGCIGRAVCNRFGKNGSQVNKKKSVAVLKTLFENSLSVE
jgi:hypothetical protein